MTWRVVARRLEGNRPRRPSSLVSPTCPSRLCIQCRYFEILVVHVHCRAGKGVGACFGFGLRENDGDRQADEPSQPLQIGDRGLTGGSLPARDPVGGRVHCSSSSVTVVSCCSCGENSDGASGSRTTGGAAGVAGVVGLAGLDGLAGFFRASSRAAFAAASISALAEASVDWSCRCAPVNSTSC